MGFFILPMPLCPFQFGHLVFYRLSCSPVYSPHRLSHLSIVSRVNPSSLASLHRLSRLSIFSRVSPSTFPLYCLLWSFGCLSGSREAPVPLKTGFQLIVHFPLDCPLKKLLDDVYSVPSGVCASLYASRYFLSAYLIPSLQLAHAFCLVLPVLL